MVAEIVVESLGLRRINVFANSTLVAWADLERDGWSGESSSGDTAAPGFTEDQIKEAVRLLFALANLKAEPTGALALGAVLSQPDRFKGKRVCCVISGGNADPALYAKLIEGI